MMERIFDHLKEQGVKVFDFSRIPPSNNETDSVYVFKNSAGGYPVQYNGEWIWSKKESIPWHFVFTISSYEKLINTNREKNEQTRNSWICALSNR